MIIRLEKNHIFKKKIQIFICTYLNISNNYKDLEKIIFLANFSNVNF